MAVVAMMINNDNNNNDSNNNNNPGHNPAQATHQTMTLGDRLDRDNKTFNSNSPVGAVYKGSSRTVQVSRSQRSHSLTV